MKVELAEETISFHATFAEKLNRLERIGAIPSVAEWKQFRAVRNALAHEYPDDPELRMSAVSEFLKGAEALSRLFKFENGYVTGSFLGKG